MKYKGLTNYYQRLSSIYQRIKKSKYGLREIAQAKKNMKRIY